MDTISSDCTNRRLVELASRIRLRGVLINDFFLLLTAAVRVYKVMFLVIEQMNLLIPDLISLVFSETLFCHIYLLVFTEVPIHPLLE